jgi:hypothetical protein
MIIYFDRDLIKKMEDLEVSSREVVELVNSKVKKIIIQTKNDFLKIDVKIRKGLIEKESIFLE